MKPRHQPRKRFGQNFLQDQHVLQKMVRCIRPQAEDHLIEIGPGQGALTQYLLDAKPELEAIEIDRDLIHILKDKFSHHPKFVLHNQDILQFDLDHLQQPAPWRIVGNLPYNISTPLLFKLFHHAQKIQDMFFLLQKEVVDRLTAEVGSADYGRLSVMSQYFCQCQSLFIVDPQAFYPVPKVDSAFVQLTPQAPKLLVNDLEQLSFVVKTAFNLRRKTIANSLKKLISSDQLKQLNIDPQWRPQNLSVEDYVRISNEIEL